MKKINYTSQEITVVWQPDLCIHSGNCVRGLPGVFNSRERPWINIEGADSDAIIAQVNKCPSGALSYLNNISKNEVMIKDENMENVKITITKNGPIMIEGEVEMKRNEGQIIPTKNKFFLCRCGHSANKPFCDGSHKKVDFIAD